MQKMHSATTCAADERYGRVAARCIQQDRKLVLPGSRLSRRRTKRDRRRASTPCREPDDSREDADSVELKWLEDFLSLAETRSFSRSANVRYITQSALSRRTRAL